MEFWRQKFLCKYKDHLYYEYVYYKYKYITKQHFHSVLGIKTKR